MCDEKPWWNTYKINSRCIDGKKTEICGQYEIRIKSFYFRHNPTKNNVLCLPLIVYHFVKSYFPCATRLNAWKCLSGEGKERCMVARSHVTGISGQLAAYLFLNNRCPKMGAAAFSYPLQTFKNIYIKFKKIYIFKKN